MTTKNREIETPVKTTFTYSNVRQLVRAIATTNGHSNPDDWADAVMEAYGATVPDENKLQPETPAV